MSPQKVVELSTSEEAQATLDLVVPFTTPELTRAALAAAEDMGTDLHATVRLIWIQIVPFPLELNQSPVALDFLREQLRGFRSALPVEPSIRLAREFEQGLLSALHRDSLVVLASKKRQWRTHTEKLAAALQRAGHKVALVYENTLKLKEKQPCLTSSTVC